MFLVEKSTFRLNFILALIFALIVAAFSPTVSSAHSNLTFKEKEEKGTAIINSVFYNTQNGKYVVDTDTLQSAGLTTTEISSVKDYFESKSANEVEQMNKEIGMEYQSEGKESRFLPLILIPIAKFLGGAVGAVIVYEVTVYGIAKACKKLKGKYKFFTDFCKTRGYI